MQVEKQLKTHKKYFWLYYIIFPWTTISWYILYIAKADLRYTHDSVHQFLNKCRRDASFSMVHTSAESLNSVLKKLCTRISNSFQPANYNNSDNNNSHMMNIYFHNGQGFLYWEGWGKSPHTSQKFSHSSPHLEKFPR